MKTHSTKKRNGLKTLAISGACLLAAASWVTPGYAAGGYGSGYGSPSGSSSSSSQVKSFHALKNAKKWMRVATAHKTVTFKVVAAFNGASSGYNFDGYANGNANFVVPLGWKVVIKFSNNSSQLTHSFGIATNHGDNLKMAMINGKVVHTPDPTMGTSQGTTVTLKFTATPAGKYFANCEMPGHSSLGMYIHFTIDKKASGPELLVR